MFINKFKKKLIFETNPLNLENKKIEETTEVFNDEVINFFDDLSVSIFKSKEIKNFPDLASFGFFCRRASIGALKKNYSNFLSDRYGRGLTLHFTPSNVPLNFAYSLFFGLITGNSNIVRLSSTIHDQSKILIKLINKLLNKKKYFLLKKKITIIRYDKSDEITRYLSSICDVRVIWGGDKTINEIRNHPISPSSFDVTFADRFSICIISSKNYLKNKNFKKEALLFFNDTLFYDQNACTSPRVVVWQGSKRDNKSASQIFWKEFEKIIKYKNYIIEGNWNYEKNYKEIKAIIDLNLKNKKNELENIKTLKLNKIPKNIQDYFTPGGFFIEFDIQRINKMKKLLTPKIQTITYIGFEGNLLKEKLSLTKIKSVDRVVPNGKASNMGLIWDGYDIFFQISKKLFII